MAKDPAFLFYPNDWDGGTKLFTRAQKGAYMDLLMCQFHNGHMTSHDVGHILGQDDYATMWESKLKAKFKQDSEGRFFNEKLENEQLKRKKWCESRRNNKEGNNQFKGHMTKHMSGHMVNVNEDVNVIKDKQPNQYYIFIDKFSKNYTDATGNPFNKHKKHFALVKKLIDTHGSEAVELKAKILFAYCRDCSAWFTQNGFADFTIEHLSSHWNSLLPQVKKTKEELAREERDIEFKKLKERRDGLC